MNHYLENIYSDFFSAVFVNTIEALQVYIEWGVQDFY